MTINIKAYVILLLNLFCGFFATNVAQVCSYLWKSFIILIAPPASMQYI